VAIFSEQACVHNRVVERAALDGKSKVMFVHGISRRPLNESFMNLSGLRSINFVTTAGKITTLTAADSYFVTHSRQISLNLP
jgi:hypothetical protein